MGAMTATAHPKNRSEQPVYDLLFIWHDDCRPVTKTQRLRPLDAQHDQLESLRKVNEKQIEVLGLQATDLRESLTSANVKRRSLGVLRPRGCSSPR